MINISSSSSSSGFILFFRNLIKEKTVHAHAIIEIIGFKSKFTSKCMFILENEVVISMSQRNGTLSNGSWSSITIQSGRSTGFNFEFIKSNSEMNRNSSSSGDRGWIEYKGGFVNGGADSEFNFSGIFPRSTFQFKSAILFGEMEFSGRGKFNGSNS